MIHYLFHLVKLNPISGQQESSQHIWDAPAGITVRAVCDKLEHEQIGGIVKAPQYLVFLNDEPVLPEKAIRDGDTLSIFIRKARGNVFFEEKPYACGHRERRGD